MRRQASVSLVLIALALLCGAGLYHFHAYTRPLNVVIISIDSLRADRMGLYGYSRDTTPNIDSFARGAVVFDNYLSTTMLTPMSEASVHTGLLPFTSGVINFESTLSTATPMLAETLRSRGYATAAFASSPEFEHYPYVKANFSRGFDTYRILNIPPGQATSSAWLSYGGRTGLATSTAISWMKARMSEGKPFFMWMPVGSVHWPYGQDEPNHFSDPTYRGTLSVFDSTNKYWGSPVNMFSRKYGLFLDSREYSTSGALISSDTKADLAYVNGRYDDGIRMTDRELASVLEYLSTPEVARRTIVIIQSEHGEDFGEHGYIGHYDLTETQTHVPLIVKAPGLSPRRVSEVVSGVDIRPTLMDALATPEKSPDGVSWWDFLTRSGKAPRTGAFITRTPLWERVIAYEVANSAPLVLADNADPQFDTALRTAEWKLVHRRSREFLQKYSWFNRLTGRRSIAPEYELYHISVDPLEQEDVYSDKGPKALELKTELLRWESGLPAQTTSPEEIQPYF